jgi:hypothetical protein
MNAISETIAKGHWMCYTCSPTSPGQIYLGRVSSISLLIVRIEMTAKAMIHKPASAVITVPDPGNSPSAVHVEMGGTLQWRNDSYNYPDFEIEFIGDNPADEHSNAIFTGDNLNPVVIHAKKTGKYKYNIRHKKADGSEWVWGPIQAYVVPCQDC